LVGFIVEVEVPATSQYLNVAYGKKALCSQSEASPVSDDGSLASRFAVMEKKHQELEDRVAALECECQQQRCDK
jgi:hypothetical protein